MLTLSDESTIVSGLFANGTLSIGIVQGARGSIMRECDERGEPHGATIYALTLEGYQQRHVIEYNHNAVVGSTKGIPSIPLYRRM